MFALTPEIDASHGNSMTEKNAFTSRTLAPKEPDGTARCVLHLVGIVQTGSTRTHLNASHSLRDAFPQRSGETESAL